MKQYIDKEAITTSIEGLKRKAFTNFDEGVNAAAQALLDFLDTLEVKDVNININNEISKFIDDNFEKASIGHKLSLRRVAKYFFELGLLYKGE